MSQNCELSLAFYSKGQKANEAFTLDITLAPPSLSQNSVAYQQIISVNDWQTISGIKLNTLGYTLDAGSVVKITITPTQADVGNDAVVGIDNFIFSDECSPSRGLPNLKCDFNGKTLCEWSQNLQIVSPELNWQFADGSQVQQLSGPGAGFNGSGDFLFVSNIIASNANLTNSYSQLTSPTYDETDEENCLTFAYMLYGQNPGALRVRQYYKKSPTNTYYTSKELFARERSTGNKWNRGHATIPKISYHYFLMIFASNGKKFDGFAAVDDVNIVRNACPPEPICDFEPYNTCGWTSKTSEQDELYWVRTSRKYTSHDSKSGPQIDHTTESNVGYFMFFETKNKKPGQKATLKSPLYPSPSGATPIKCFSFWYHMYGDDVGTLTVSMFPTKQRRILFQRQGNHNNHWWRGQIQIDESMAPTETFQINIEAVRADSDNGDMAIDDAGVLDGPCSPVGTCNFENSECGFGNIYELNDIDWLRSNGATPSKTSGPSVDHTTGDALGYYMFVNSATVKEAGSSAYFASEIIQGSSQGHCLTFWYHKYGVDSGTLEVLLQEPNLNKWETSKLLWGTSGPKENDEWYSANVNVVTDKEYAIVFAVNFTKVGENGDIALDDISIDTSGPCSQIRPDPDPQMFYPCGFESSDCGFKVADSNNILTWRVGSGFEPVKDHAPKYDHTFNDQSGHYVSHSKVTKKSFSLFTLCSLLAF